MTCHVPAQSREEAVNLLKKWFRETLTDMSMEFPEIKQETKAIPAVDMGKREQIGTLIKELSTFFSPESTFPDTVKKFTDGLDATPENYDEIISRMSAKLTICQSGVKKVDSTESNGEIISVHEDKKKK